jgi:hypothetical protein
MSDNLNREEKAVDALITGTLHPWSKAEPSEAEINQFLTNKNVLNDAEKAALDRVGERFSNASNPGYELDQTALNKALESSYMAMNRENAKDQLPVAAREEIEKKRAMLLEKLKAKKKSTG